MENWETYAHVRIHITKRTTDHGAHQQSRAYAELTWDGKLTTTHLDA